MVALFALLNGAGRAIKRLVSTVWRWKVWTLVSRPCRHMITRYRLQIAKKLIRRELQGATIRVGIRVYDGCLQSDARQSIRSQLKQITPDKPTWLNDYYVATALESLSAEGSVAKAISYSPNSWPPNPETYLFLNVNGNASAQEIASKIETDGKCRAYQQFAWCPKPPRFDINYSAETVSVREARRTTSFPLKDMAPPCELCWEKEYRERDTRNLVESFIRYDFGDAATAEITSELTANYRKHS